MWVYFDLFKIVATAEKKKIPMATHGYSTSNNLIPRCKARVRF
jgi:hypothetical protein